MDILRILLPALGVVFIATLLVLDWYRGRALRRVHRDAREQTRADFETLFPGHCFDCEITDCAKHGRRKAP